MLGGNELAVGRKPERGDLDQADLAGRAGLGQNNRGAFMDLVERLVFCFTQDPGRVDDHGHAAQGVGPGGRGIHLCQVAGHFIGTQVGARAHQATHGPALGPEGGDHVATQETAGADDQDCTIGRQGGRHGRSVAHWWYEYNQKCAKIGYEIQA